MRHSLNDLVLLSILFRIFSISFAQKKKSFPESSSSNLGLGLLSRLLLFHLLQDLLGPLDGLALLLAADDERRARGLHEEGPGGRRRVRVAPGVLGAALHDVVARPEQPRLARVQQQLQLARDQHGKVHRRRAVVDGRRPRHEVDEPGHRRPVCDAVPVPGRQLSSLVSHRS